MRKTIIFVACLAVLFTFLPVISWADYPVKFPDVPSSHWAFEQIADLQSRNVIQGYENGYFRPNKTVTRAEWAKIMVGAADIPANDSDVHFSDTANHWGLPYINAARVYLTSYSNNTYRPNIAAVREDVIVSMARLLRCEWCIEEEYELSYLTKFTDSDSISDGLKKYVAVAIERGLIEGFPDNTIRGQATVTRAEAAVLLWRAVQKGACPGIKGVGAIGCGGEETAKEPVLVPVITTTSLPSGTVGTIYNQSLKATGDTPITWSVSGNLPTGLTRNGAVILGTPTTAGTYNFTVTASNAHGNSSKDLTIVINQPEPPPGISISGTTVSGTIQFKDDEVRYTYSAPETGRFRFTLTTQNGLQFVISVYNPEGTKIDSATDAVTLDLEKGLAYRVVVSQNYKNHTGNFTLNIITPKTPNNTPISGTSVSGTIQFKDDEVRYTYIAPETGRYRFTLATYNDLQFVISIYNPQGTRIATANDAVTVDLENGITYRVIVSQNYRSHTGNFTLNIITPLPNNMPISGTTASGTIQFKDDEVQYTYTAPETGRYRFALDTQDDLQFTISIYNPQGTRIATANDAVTVDLESGIIYRVVVSQNYRSHTGNFTLNITPPTSPLSTL